MTFLRVFIPAFLAGLTLSCAAVLAAGEPEYDTNRMGGDFDHVVMDIDAPLECRRICEGNPACEAWTYVKPGIQGPMAMCWLKNSVPPPTADSCCISGVRPAYGSFEPSTNRYGGDYAGFELAVGAVPFECSKLCYADASCAAWSYVEAGIQGPSPMCWLKNVVPEPSLDTCCTSGVK